jgi:hypothetical protein
MTPLLVVHRPFRNLNALLPGDFAQRQLRGAPARVCFVYATRTRSLSSMNNSYLSVLIAASGTGFMNIPVVFEI